MVPTKDQHLDPAPHQPEQRSPEATSSILLAASAESKGTSHTWGKVPERDIGRELSKARLQRWEAAHPLAMCQIKSHLQGLAHFPFYSLYAISLQEILLPLLLRWETKN